jgi:bifunctional non-homologous end joining protein LigD
LCSTNGSRAIAVGFASKAGVSRRGALRSPGREDFIQLAPNSFKCRQRRALFFFLFDLLYLDGEVTNAAPLTERKERLRHLMSNVGTPLQYSNHQIGRGPEFNATACELSLEGIVSEREDALYLLAIAACG